MLKRARFAEAEVPGEGNRVLLTQGHSDSHWEGLAISQVPTGSVGRCKGQQCVCPAEAERDWSSGPAKAAGLEIKSEDVCAEDTPLSSPISRKRQLDPRCSFLIS